jgi:hypothetical protein
MESLPDRDINIHTEINFFTIHVLKVCLGLCIMKDPPEFREDDLFVCGGGHLKDTNDHLAVNKL